MFEKEAEEYANEHNHEYYTDNDTFGACFSGFQDGAEFGYKAGKPQWHKVSEQTPTEEKDYLVKLTDGTV
ncbi:MAG: hypothetical protein K6B75_06040 [Lachnospiraceae bacterium]|nr:hypothetical protein [Lachnospiraceae bacterium]